MKIRQRWLLVTLLLTGILGSSPAAQTADTPQCITLRIEFPDLPDQAREFSTGEGRATAMVQVKDGDEYPSLYLDLTIRDLDARLVGISIRNDRDSDRVVDEFDVQAGGEGFRTVTTPSLVLSVLEVFARKGATCAG